MRYLSPVLLSVVLTGCSLAGLGDHQTSNCAPQCIPYIASGNAVPTYAQPTYIQQNLQTYYNPSSPAGYATQPSQYSYGTRAQLLQSAKNHGTHAYAQVPQSQWTQAHAQMPQLRGSSNPYSPRGYKYGNLGAILYDFDSEKFGIQGRIGYQSAGLFGAELEGSISLGADTKELNANETAAIMGIPATANTPQASTLTTEIANSVAAFGLVRLLSVIA